MMAAAAPTALVIILSLAPAKVGGQAGQSPAPQAGAAGGRGGRGGAPPAPGPPFARTPDGKPDMQGYWTSSGFNAAVFEVQDHPVARPGIAAGRGAIVDPPDGRIPYQAWAAAKATDNFEHHMYNEPELHCFQSGTPKQMWVQFGFQIVQSPGHVIMLWEFMHANRIIPTDGRPHIPANIKLFQGDPVGHWEGNTLVVDTTSLNDKTWFDLAGNFHSDAMHVVERFMPVDANRITYEAVIEDPAVYTRPWKVAGGFARNTQPNYEQMEFACIEGNKDLQHYIEEAGGKSKKPQ